MSYEIDIQSKIKQLEGGAFQRIFDAYLFKKYKLDNIQQLGVQTSSNKTTKGTPDSYVLTVDGKYILINYGTVSENPAKKIQDDITSCFNYAELNLGKSKIKKIICGHCSTNINPEQYDKLIHSIPGVEIELIGIDTLSQDLYHYYPKIAKDYLGITIDTNQIFCIDDFVKAHKNNLTTPLDSDFLYRTDELLNINKSIEEFPITVLTGLSGIGKTRLALESCRNFEKDKHIVYCVRFSCLQLYDDFRHYINTPGKYLIFFDDANTVNSLENVLTFLFNMPEQYDIKILATVRNYAKQRVIDTISKKSEFNVIDICSLKDNEIKEIIAKNLSILNSSYLNRITEISKGNIRLAFMAGKRSLTEGLCEIQNAEDIFKRYYDPIITEINLCKSSIIILFLIALSGPVYNAENSLYQELKKKYAANISDEEEFEKLYSLELIDWYRNEVERISDQSFANYILYYVIWKKKWIHLDDFIMQFFPVYSQKVVYALKTLIEVFNSDDLRKYVENSVNAAWNKCSKEQENDYLNNFYLVNMLKSLCILKKFISNEKTVQYELNDNDFKKNNFSSIFENSYIEILGKFKYQNIYGDALDLMFLYFSKRPDLVKDFYNTITSHCLYDKESANNGYSQEALLLEKLWQKTNSGADYNFTILYLHVCSSALKTEFSYATYSRECKHSTFFINTIIFSEAIDLLRKKILESFAVLRKKKEYAQIINSILNDRYYDLNDENSVPFMESDFNTIVSKILKNKVETFFDAQIVEKYSDEAKILGIEINYSHLNLHKNKEFHIYKILTQNYLEKGYEESHQYRKRLISNEIKEYKLGDFQELFRICSSLQEDVPNYYRTIGSGLDIVFELLENNKQLYIDSMIAYFSAGAPFELNYSQHISYLLKNIGYESTLKLVTENLSKNRELCESFIWEKIESDNITPKVVSDYKKFLNDNVNEENYRLIPSLFDLCRYSEKDKEIRELVTNKLVASPILSFFFLQPRISYIEEDIKQLLIFYQNDLDSLLAIYMNALYYDCKADENGKIFIKIFEVRNDIWQNYISWIKAKNQTYKYKKNYIVEKVWNCDEWKKNVYYAFNELNKNEDIFVLEEPAILLFKKSESIEIMERKKIWLYEALEKYSKDKSQVIRLVKIVVTMLPELKIEYILKFLEYNENINDFKSLHLFSDIDVFSGSYIPYINKKIDFLNSLKNNLRGINYIEHKEYIEHCIQKQEALKKEVELNEYLENDYYA